MGRKKKKVDVLFITRESCAFCQNELTKLTRYMDNKSKINFQVIDLDSELNNYPKKNSSIVPSIWVNDKMWYAGEVNLDRFDEKINELLNLQ
ncbi:MAG: thioredoxin family protein [Candidatus Neomarinimicrobiota bacterium]